MEADFHGWGMLLACYNSQSNNSGMQICAEKIIEQVEKVLAEDSDNGTALALGALSFAALGQMASARQWIERALLLDPDNLYMRYNLAWGLIAIFNDAEAAVDMLEPFLEKAGPSAIRLAANDPNLDRLRGDPRFQGMLASAKERLGVGPGAFTYPAASALPRRS